MQVSNEKLTLEEFLAMPETKPASEFIDGQIIQKPMSTITHSRLRISLAIAIHKALRESKIAIALPGIRCTFNRRVIVPDIGVFTQQHIPIDNNGDIANDFRIHPDWIIEILVPEQNSTKVTDKILHSLEHGTEMGWLIDPQDQLIMVYQKGQPPKALKDAQTQLPVPDFANSINLTLTDIFDWLKF